MYFANSNIDTRDEYERRLAAARKVAEAEGVELSDEQLDGIAGGDSFWCPTATSCPNYEVMR
jgi:hypothetical protein